MILSRELDKRRRAKEFSLFGGWLSSEVGKGALVLNVFNELVKYGSYKYIFTKHRVHKNNPFLGWPLKPKSSSC